MSKFDDIWSPEETAKTFVQNWPLNLLPLTMPHYQLPLPAETRHAIINVAECGFDGKAPEPPMQGQLRQFAAALKGPLTNLNPVFPRLGSRSPKDCGSSLRCEKPSDIVKALIMSERVWEDLRDDEALKRPSYLFLRKWLEIPKHSEFRCFVKDRRLVGVSQYFYNETFQELQESAKHWIKMLVQFMDHRVIPTLLTDSAVVDLFFQNPVTVRFLEINPFDCRTDPCLFTDVWDDLGELNETLLFLGDNGIVSLPLYG